MRLYSLFPELATRVVRDLRAMQRTDLAEQVRTLEVVDRCRCGLERCGTFYCQDAEFRRRSQKGGSDLILPSGVIVTEARGTIVEIQTLDPEVEAGLRRVIPGR